MTEFPEETLRKRAIGVWKFMPEPQEPDWSVKPKTKFTVSSRMGLQDVSWRVSTRHEINSYFDSVMKSTYKHLAVTIISMVGALYSLSLFMASRDFLFAAFAVVFAALTSRHYTRAWGGYAGVWSDYELDPVQVLPHSAYVATGNKLM